MEFPLLREMADLDLVVLLKATQESLDRSASASDERFKVEILQELKNR